MFDGLTGGADKCTTPLEARRAPVPSDFRCDGCTGFPDRVLGVDLYPICREHDWHYELLRRHDGVWSEEEWEEFREWADLWLALKVYDAMRRRCGKAVGDFFARLMLKGVRAFGECAARKA